MLSSVFELVKPIYGKIAGYNNGVGNRALSTLGNEYL